MSIILKILIWQLIVAAGAIGILKVVLDKNLIESAVKQFEHLCQHCESTAVSDIVVVTQRPLTQTVSERIRRVAHKRFGGKAGVRYQTDKHMWGGIIIRLAGTVINFSLKDRLHQAFGK